MSWLSANAPAPDVPPSRPAEVPPAASSTGDVVAWAVATGRVAPENEPAWRGRLALNPASITATLKGMAPVHASRPAAVATGPYSGQGSTLPAFTASGMDPSALLQYPAPLRPAIAGAATQAEAYALARDYAGMSDDQVAKAMATDLRIPDEYAHSWATATNYVDPVRAQHAEMEAASAQARTKDARHRQQVLAADEDRRRRENPEEYAFWDAMRERQSRRG